ncbi:hypothetical protein JA1_002387 [Spathaspora sp. JA1]|nr:hypothetical protein JA1_002387 [Spathaspora sp. JA1]
MPKSDSRPRTKSRNGCHTCKRKRLKCDETKPQCMNCRKRKIQCGGYAVNFKWKSFNESEQVSTDTATTTTTTSTSPSVASATSNEFKQHLELVSISVTGKSIMEINKENELISLGLNPNNYTKEDQPNKLNSLVEAATLIDHPSPPTTPKSPHSSIFSPELKTNLNIPHEFDIGGVTPSSFSAIVNFAFEDIDALTMIEAQTPTSQPKLTTSSMTESLINSSSEQQHLLYLYSEYTCSILSIKNGTKENPWRELILPQAIHYPCLYNSMASMTLFHLSGSLNPEAMADMRSRGYSYMKKCVFELLKGLSSAEEVKLPADIALATCLNLAFIDSWYTPTTSGIAHLKGAKSMIERVLKILNEKSESTDKLVLVDNNFDRELEQGKIHIPKSIQFLFNVWIYLQVLAQMTSNSNQDDKGVDLVAAITSMSQPVHKNANPETTSESGEQQETSPSTDPFSISPLIDFTNYTPELIDPLLGCGQSLFSIMGKVANLSIKIRKSKTNAKHTNSIMTISTASNLKQQLINWKPPISSTDHDHPFTPTDSTTWDIPQCIATAESYKYATLIYLHQSVPEIPCLSSHKLAQKIFFLLASIPEDSNLHVVLIFPILVASCEANPGEERDWCVDRWRILFEKMGIGNVERAFDIVKEVWKRKDEQMNEVNDKSEEEDNKYDQLSGLMAVVNESDCITNGIFSNTHWSTIMKEWGWEVLLG